MSCDNILMSWNGGIMLDDNTIPISRWWLQSTWQGHTQMRSKSMISQWPSGLLETNPQTKALALEKRLVGSPN